MKPTFNETNQEIEWARWTWNPVTGCKHNCLYCYARDIGNRIYKEGFKPTFRPERLAAPANTKLPKNPALRDRGVFVCSMADLFGDWVPNGWIELVLNEVRNNKQWDFIFLTKNPKRLLTFDFPDNAWLGATVDIQSRVEITESVFKRLKAKIKFISCEPLMEKLTFSTLEMIDWLIIGGLSETSKASDRQPKWEWVEALLWKARKSNAAVYFKPNLKVRPREYPKDENEGIKYEPLKQRSLFE